jgi:hypothetical protein
MLIATQVVDKIQVLVKNLKDVLGTSEYGEGCLFHLETIDPTSIEN